MKLVSLLLFSTIYGETLQYPSDIASFSFSWTNPDNSGSTTATGPVTPGIVTDHNTTTGEILSFPGASYAWGVHGITKGMIGDFAASVLIPSQGKDAWNIQAAQIVFSGCVGDGSTASAYYYNLNGVKINIGDATIELPSDTNNYLTTFTAPITIYGVRTNGAIGFSVMSNMFCEAGDIAIQEFILEGVEVETDAPTKKPTRRPTPRPAPRPAPRPTIRIRNMPNSGGESGGDPHFWLMAMDTAATEQYSYHGLGWHYYLFPCSMDLYEQWPFFLMSYHSQCGPNRACISNNRLILNTRPEPWIIEFTDSTLQITVGTDTAGRSAADFDTTMIYTENNPLVIEYNDNQTLSQYGELRIFWDNSFIVLQLYNVGYYGYPRICNFGQTQGQGAECGSYQCEGKVIDIRNRGSFIAFSNPPCIRSITCGLMGKYFLNSTNQCSTNDLKDVNNECYNILVGSDGNVYTPPTRNVFKSFAVTWSKDAINASLSAKGLVINYLRNKYFNETEADLKPITIALNVTNTDIFAETDCFGDIDRINSVNETCRINTVLKYGKCCKEIDMCPLLWGWCIEDLCACTTSDETGNTLSDSECLKTIVYDIMNATCSSGLSFFYRAATPIAAKENKTETFVWFALIFVLFFVMVAVAAYCYYRKANGVKVAMDEFEDEVKIGTQTSTNTGTFTSQTQNNKADNINLNPIDFNSKQNENVAVTFIHYQE